VHGVAYWPTTARARWERRALLGLLARCKPRRRVWRPTLTTTTTRTQQTTARSRWRCAACLQRAQGEGPRRQRGLLLTNHCASNDACASCNDACASCAGDSDDAARSPPEHCRSVGWLVGWFNQMFNRARRRRQPASFGQSKSHHIGFLLPLLSRLAGLWCSSAPSTKVTLLFFWSGEESSSLRKVPPLPLFVGAVVTCGAIVWENLRCSPSKSR